MAYLTDHMDTMRSRSQLSIQVSLHRLLQYISLRILYFFYCYLLLSLFFQSKLPDLSMTLGIVLFLHHQNLMILPGIFLLQQSAAHMAIGKSATTAIMLTQIKMDLIRM